MSEWGEEGGQRPEEGGARKGRGGRGVADNCLTSGIRRGLVSELQCGN